MDFKFVQNWKLPIHQYLDQAALPERTRLDVFQGLPGLVDLGYEDGSFWVTEFQLFKLVLTLFIFGLFTFFWLWIANLTGIGKKMPRCTKALKRFYVFGVFT
jgi:hypothetical protein